VVGTAHGALGGRGRSIGLAELGAGAGAAALGAVLAEVAEQQAATRFRMRIRWLVPALRLPGQILAYTAVVFAALARQLIRGEQPASGIEYIGASPVSVRLTRTSIVMCLSWGGPPASSPGDGTPTADACHL